MPERLRKESELTSSRKSYLSKLAAKMNKNTITAVLAQHGNGKTLLLKELEKTGKLFYLDLKRLAISPENFAVELIGNICFFMEKNGNRSDFRTIDALKDLKLRPNSKNIIAKVDNELQKIKPDQLMLVEQAFSFAETIAGEHKTSIVIAIDNFEEILALNNFSSIHDIIKTFIDTISDNDSARFVIASSSVYQFRRLLRPFNDIQTLELSSFTAEETKEVFERIVGKTDKKILDEVMRVTGGTPIAVTTIARRFKSGKDRKKDTTFISDILLSELCTTTSSLYDYSQSLYHHSLNRARGASLLKTVIKVMSQDEPMRLSEIARQIYRSAPVTKSLLERLIEVDLVVKDNNTFDFTNPLLKRWCALMFDGIEFKDTPTDEELKKIGGMQ